MTRVLHIIPTLQRGGAERMLTQLVTFPRTEGPAPEQMVVALMDGGPFEAEMRAAGVAVRVLHMDSWTGAPACLLRLYGALKDWRPDVVQSWLYYSDLAALLARLPRGGGRPRLYWNIRCSSLDFAAYGPALRTAARVSARLSRLPDRIVVNSRTGMRAHRDLGYAEEKFLLIPNGIDVDRFAPAPARAVETRRSLGIADGSFVVSHLARVDPQKDHATLVELARRLPAIVFVAAGRGTDALPGPSNLLRLGDRADATDLLNAADVVLSTSAYGEGFPNVVAEGMACGKPAVATDCGDAGDIVGDAGRLAAVGDVAAMTGALSELARLSGQERSQLGRRARERIVARYSLAQAVRRYDRLHRFGKGGCEREDPLE